MFSVCCEKKNVLNEKCIQEFCARRIAPFYHRETRKENWHYNPSRRNKFSSFAENTLYGEIAKKKESKTFNHIYIYIQYITQLECTFRVLSTTQNYVPYKTFLLRRHGSTTFYKWYRSGEPRKYKNPFNVSHLLL